MQMLVTATRLDWSGWMLGMWGALVSGGAGAIGATVGVTTFDPSHDLGGKHLLAVAALSFSVSGIVSLAKFLQMHPVPDAEKP